jgi:hypothetical protein
MQDAILLRIIADAELSVRERRGMVGRVLSQNVLQLKLSSHDAIGMDHAGKL